ncbi:MAG: hypothetical protein LAO55_25755 [Acidobacteriia bacterium]|nr:hypothetical protein [Terriglobia bacterium]
MTNRLLRWGAALAFSAVAFAGSKTYDVLLSSGAKAGSVQLAPGEYRLKVEGSNAIFTGTENRQSFTVPVKVENTNTRYSATALDTVKQGDTVKITSIQLGGSKTKLEFGQ